MERTCADPHTALILLECNALTGLSGERERCNVWIVEMSTRQTGRCTTPTSKVEYNTHFGIKTSDTYEIVFCSVGRPNGE